MTKIIMLRDASVIVPAQSHIEVSDEQAAALISAGAAAPDIAKKEQAKQKSKK